MVHSIQNLVRKLPFNGCRSSIVRCRINKHNLSHRTYTNNQRVIIHDLEQGIKHVELNRPDKLNSLDMEMFHAIANAAKELRHDKTVRVILLSGKGRAFCTGLDVQSIMLPSKKKSSSSNNKEEQVEEDAVGGGLFLSPSAKVARLLKRPSGYQRDKEESFTNNNDDDDDDIFHDKVMAMGNLAQDIAYLWRDIPVPVIAVLTGMCFGGGLQLALGADFRYSTKDCKFSIMESKWGLIPDMGASITLRELVRMDVAKELTFTGRVFHGEEAEKLGLVTRCSNDDDDPMADALDMAKTLVKRSPDSIAGAKMLFQRTWTSSERECLELETKIQRQLLPSWNQFVASAKNFGMDGLPYGKRQEWKDD
mmetsp:Transcript_16147/g.30506  ORF Transcript_16147/g.30506 Transcript_16147/m.30506 type:complete len:365 (+) Transcript_16147:107-1201(+)